MSQNQIQYYLCGGTGINIGVALKKNSRTEQNKKAQFVALDSSGANKHYDLFPVERMLKAGSTKEEARGSGKVKATNYPQMEAFVDSCLSKYKPADFNVVVANTSGGTGSVMAVMVLRALIKMGKPVVYCAISDFTSQVDMNNAVGTLRSVANQTAANLLNQSIPFIHFTNTTEKTFGQVNEVVVDRLNLLSIFLTEDNEHMDYQDIANFLAYSKHYGVAPALSEIRFFDQESLQKFEGKAPVAVASLFDNAENIIPRFEGTVIRTIGVFKEGASRPNNTTELHMVLDHGDALEELEERMARLEEVKVASKATYVQQKDLSAGADENGMIL